MAGTAAWWAESLNWLQDWAGTGSSQWPGAPAGYKHFAELDIFEYFNKWVNRNQYAGTMNDWYGQWDGKTFRHTSNSNRFYTSPPGPSNFNNQFFTPPAGHDFTKYHKYGALWVPSVNGSTGFVQFYVDDQPRTKVTWVGSPPNPFDGTTPGKTPWTFSIIDQQRMMLMLWSPSTGSMYVDWVRVWGK